MKAKEAEVVRETQLQVIVKESGLEPTKGQFILEKFTEYFDMASEWEIKARNIVVTKPDQKAEMEMARTGRLFLKEKRVAVEKARKELKEQALREGKAIDGIANVLKALIVPIEEYLERQKIEDMAQAEREKRDEALRLERAKTEKDRQAEAEKSRKLQIEREKKIAEARAKVDEERKEKERLAEMLKARVECPFCHKRFAIDKFKKA